MNNFQEKCKICKYDVNGGCMFKLTDSCNYENKYQFGSLNYIKSEASLNEDVLSVTPHKQEHIIELGVKMGFDDNKMNEFIENHIPLGWKVHLSLEEY